MNESNGRPKVEIGLNQEIRLKLSRDKAFTGQNSYGNYYLYSVSEDGVEKSFFATEEVHKRILEEGLRSGDTFLIRKKAVQNGKKLLSRIEFEVVKTPFLVPANGSGGGHASEDQLKDVLLQCVRDADFVIRSADAQISDELQKLATTLFIARTRLS